MLKITPLCYHQKFNEVRRQLQSTQKTVLSRTGETEICSIRANSGWLLVTLGSKTQSLNLDSCHLPSDHPSHCWRGKGREMLEAPCGLIWGKY